MDTQWIATRDVRVGDRLVCSLSDAIAYPTVTGWSDRVLSKGERYETTHRTFTVSGDVPWWVDYDRMQVTGTLADGTLGQVSIVTREGFTTGTSCADPGRTYTTLPPMVCECGFIPAPKIIQGELTRDSYPPAMRKL